jgi:hypothetical protein
MKKRHAVVELPKQNKDLDKLISDENHHILHLSFSSAVVEGQLQHYVLVVWHDEEYGDHEF